MLQVILNSLYFALYFREAKNDAMNKSCREWYVYHNQNLTDTLDKYVVLAFFLTLIFTIIITLLIVKYVRYNIHREKTRQMLVKEKTKCSRNFDEEVSESSEDEFYVPDENDIDAVNPLDKINDKLTDKEETDDEKLGTNYVSIELDDVNSMKFTVATLDYDLLNQLYIETEYIPLEICICNIFTNFLKDVNSMKLLPDIPGRYTNWRLRKLGESVKQGFLAATDFLFELLLSMNQIKQAQLLSFKSKFEQIMEEKFFNKSIDQNSKWLASIRESVETCLVGFSKEEREELLNELFSKNLLTNVKLFNGFLKDEALIVTKELIMTVEAFLEIYKRLRTYKCRSKLLCERIMKIRTPENRRHVKEACFEHENNVKTLTETMADITGTEIQSCGLNLSNIALSSLKNKHNNELIELKSSIIYSTNENTRNTFKEYLSNYFVLKELHEKEFSVTHSEIKKEQLSNLKQLVASVVTASLKKLKRLEDNLLSRLNQEFGISDDEIIEIVSSVQNVVKKLSTKFEVQKKNCISRIRTYLNESFSSIQSITGTVIKLLSQQYKFYQNVTFRTLDSYPGLKKRSVDCVDLKLNQYLSIMVYELLHTMLLHVNLGFQHEIENFKIDTKNTDPIVSPHSIFEYIFQDSVSGEKVSDDFLCLFQNTFTSRERGFRNVLEQKIFNEYFPLIKETFRINTLRRLKTDLVDILLDQLESDCNLYTRVFEKLKKLSSFKKSSNGKHVNNDMSREGNSMRKISEQDEVEDLYNLHCGMKETKYEAFCESSFKLKVESRQTSDGIVSQVISMLECIETPPEFLHQLHTLDSHYVGDLLLEKLEKMEQNLQEELKNSPSEKRNTERQSNKPRGRKSRKVASASDM